MFDTKYPFPKRITKYPFPKISLYPLAVPPSYPFLCYPNTQETINLLSITIDLFEFLEFYISETI